MIFMKLNNNRIIFSHRTIAHAATAALSVIVRAKLPPAFPGISRERVDTTSICVGVTSPRATTSFRLSFLRPPRQSDTRRLAPPPRRLRPSLSDVSIARTPVSLWRRYAVTLPPARRLSRSFRLSFLTTDDVALLRPNNNNNHETPPPFPDPFIQIDILKSTKWRMCICHQNDFDHAFCLF